MTPTNRQQAVNEARAWIAENPLYLDTETTGLGVSDAVVEIALVDQQGKVLLDTLVKPNRSIPPEATAVHGITREMTSDAPAWPDVWAKVEPLLHNRPVGMYNAEFDLKLIQQTHYLNWMRWSPPAGAQFFDIMDLYARFRGERNLRSPGYRWVSLEQAVRQCRIPVASTHRAKDDTLLTRALLNFIAAQG
jgi:DNA polymerase-3 subunit epsilon